MNNFGADPVCPPLVTIDVRRGHLDPFVGAVPGLPGAEARTIRNNAAFPRTAGRAKVPVTHMLTLCVDTSGIRIGS